ncbi:MAG: RNA 2',3'-cyclic phosphodiesterase [Trueperaceae bacterium]
MRLFVALAIPHEVRAVLRAAQETLADELTDADVRWQELARSHLTLRFLGDVPERGLANWRFAVDSAARGTRQFMLRTGGFGVFPGPARPAVLWLGVTGETEELGHLQAQLERALQRTGTPPSEVAFRPHLTLGRVRRIGQEGRTRMAALLSGERPVEPVSWPVDSVQLFHSQLSPKGASHVVLHESVLTPSDAAG